MKLIVGIGNPGEEHQKSRHNLGFMVLDRLVASSKQPVVWEKSEKVKSYILRLSPDVILAKPFTYMNNSGLAVKLLTTYYKLLTTDVIIVHDELDLPLGKIKVRLGGAAAGHHGVESIIKALNNDKFVRVRLGIGNLRTQSAEHGSSHIDPNHFVLEPFMSNEKSKLKHLLKQAVEAVELVLEQGLDKAQNQFN